MVTKEERKQVWVVGQLHYWDKLKSTPQINVIDDCGSIGYLPVFETREQAELVSRDNLIYGMHTCPRPVQENQ